RPRHRRAGRGQGAAAPSGTSVGVSCLCLKHRRAVPAEQGDGQVLDAPSVASSVASETGSSAGGGGGGTKRCSRYQRSSSTLSRMSSSAWWTSRFSGGVGPLGYQRRTSSLSVLTSIWR